MEQKQMDRDLKTRHISMIAIGGSLGTGLFMASGAIVSQAGPGGALVAYMLIGVMIYFLMTSLGNLLPFIRYPALLVHMHSVLSIQLLDLQWDGCTGSSGHL